MFNKSSFGALVVCASCVASVSAQDLPSRELPEQTVRAADLGLDEAVSQAKAKQVSQSVPPCVVFVAESRHCSSFDLYNGTLNYFGHDFAQIYPMAYLGKVLSFHITWEISPYGWIWIFADDGRIYHFDPSESNPIIYKYADGKALKLENCN